MDILIEKVLIYGVSAIFIVAVLFVYIRKLIRESKSAEQKIFQAIENGLHEPVSLHPVVDVNSCIKSGACVKACPEKDVIGIRNGKATVINASRCIGHGACVMACPVQAITLCIGTEKRGVDLPDTDQTFQTNVPGIYIAGEIGGMGLIKNAIEQGKQAIDYLSQKIDKKIDAQYDVIIVGAGPAGISGSLAAKKKNLNALTLEQDSLGGTVFTYPRSKIVMTSSVDLPLYGRVKFRETTKSELLNLWEKVLTENKIEIRENTKVESIKHVENYFVVSTTGGETYSTRKVLLAIGRRGTPRKLNIPGEVSEKVAYRLLEPEQFHGKEIVVVGGGDSAIESALQLAGQNQVHLIYRGQSFNRIKPKNDEKIKTAIADGKVKVLFNSNLTFIEDDSVHVSVEGSGQIMVLKNDLVFIFAGGELSSRLIEATGIKVVKKFGEAILKNDR